MNNKIMGIFNFLNKLGTNNVNVGVFISPRSVLEVVQFDSETKQVLKYGKIDLAYDQITRQISSPESFEMSIQKLFEDLNIPGNSPIVLSLPTIMMNHQTLPATLVPDEIRVALTSEAERNYIFKRHEPTVSWEVIATNTETDSQFLLYSAVQKDEVTQIESIFSKLNMNLVAIDSSYAALIRGLSITGIADEDVAEGKLWSILLITPNSFANISLMGNKIIDISEDPVAIKSFAPEDLYPTLASYSIEGIRTKSPDHVVVISESDEVSAEVLSTYFDLNCKISYIEINKHNKTPLFSGEIDIIAEKQQVVSLEAVGAANWKLTDIPISFNFASKDGSRSATGPQVTILGKQIVLSTKLLQTVLLGLFGLSFISMAGIYLICSSLNGALDKTLQDLTGQVSQLKSSATPAVQQTGSSESDVVNSIYDKNGQILQSYNAVGAVIPEKLWIDQFELHDNLNAVVKGKAYSVEDIISYYQNLTRTAKFQNFKITNIKVIGKEDFAQSGNNNGVSIVPKEENGGTELPGLPSLSSSSGQKYYEFGLGSASTQAAANPAQGASGPGGAMPGEMSGGMSEAMGPGQAK